MNAPTDLRTPVTLLTGFLGSGKTTVLNRFLQHPELRDTAVIINEFADIGIDHLLVEQVQENLRVLRSGCVCCTVRGDLVDTLLELDRKRATGQIPAFSRVLLETTGLAEPVPILHALMAAPGVAQRYRMAKVVCTVDAVHAAATLERHAESARQIAMADHVLLTKTDLAGDNSALRQRVQELNPAAQLSTSVAGAVAPDVLLAGPQASHWRLPGRPGVPAAGAPLQIALYDHHPAAGAAGHAAQAIRAHCFELQLPVDEEALNHWLALMASMRGAQLLRVKGLVRTLLRPDEPLVLHCVQHLLHPPYRLPTWPGGDRRACLVFITQGLDPSDIQRTFAKYVGAGLVQISNPPSTGEPHHD